MKKYVKILIILNLITYINSFLFSFTYKYFNEELKINYLILGAWILSPFLLLTITSFILAVDNISGFKIFYKEALADWVMRFLSSCFAFQEFYFQNENIYIMQQVILIFLLIVNVILELKMYKKEKLHSPVSGNCSNNTISEKEKLNVLSMGKAVTSGMISFIVFGLSLGILDSVPTFNNLIIKIGCLILCVLIFIWFLQKNYEKCLMFYLNKELAKDVFKKDALISCIGFIICFLLEIKIMVFKSDTYIPYPIITILLLYPTIKTNRKMALRYKKVLKSLKYDY